MLTVVNVQLSVLLRVIQFEPRKPKVAPKAAPKVEKPVEEQSATE